MGLCYCIIYLSDWLTKLGLNQDKNTYLFVVLFGPVGAKCKES